MAFPITCPSCGKGFQLATEIYERKVAGKVVSIKCKQCHAAIRVDATSPGELKVTGASAAAAGADSVITKQPSIHDGEKEAQASSPVRARQPTLLGLVGPGGQARVPSAERGAAPAPPAPPPPPEALWAVDSGGTGDDRELTDEQMKREIEAGVLGATTLVWREGQDDWLEISKVPQLARYLSLAKPAAAPRPRQASAPAIEPPRQPPQMQEPSPTAEQSDDDEEDATMIYARRKAGGAKLNLPDLPPESERGAAAPAAPAWNVAPGILPAAGRPAAPAPKAAPPPPPPPPSAPFAAPPPPPPPLGPAQPVPSAFTTPAAPQPAAPTPLAGAAFPTPPAVPPAPRSPQAPVPGAPGAPPAPTPMGVMAPSPFAVAATTTDLDFPKPKSKLPLVIGALVAVGVVIGVVVVMSSGSKPPPVATPAAPPPTPTTAPSPTTEATTPPAATETATAVPTPAPGSGRDPLAPPTSTPSSKSGSGFSDLFAAGMEKAQKSGVVTTPAQPFDQEEARRAVAAVLRTVAACKEPGSPLGQTTAAVTFESSGRVSSVTIGAPFAGTSTGTCMVTAFKQVKVTPFAGLPGTVSQAVSLR